MIKLKDVLKEEGIELGKVYTAKDNPPFQVNEGKGKFGTIYNMKDEMKSGEFNPELSDIFSLGITFLRVIMLWKED